MTEISRKKKEGENGRPVPPQVFYATHPPETVLDLSDVSILPFPFPSKHRALVKYDKYVLEIRSITRKQNYAANQC